MTTAAAPILLYVSPALLTPSPLNPRTKFKEKDLEDLVGSLRQHGVIEPLIVRPLTNKGASGYEIVCGERRWRAATQAELKEIPIVVRQLDDKTVVEMQLEENLKRKNMHPLDEAKGFEELLRLSPGVTPAAVGTSLGVSERYVLNRLHYRELEKSVRQAFYDDQITSGHVDLIVRLSKEDQKRALDACFVETFYDEQREELVDVETPVETKRLVSVRELDRWIKGSIRIDIAARAPKLEMFPEVQQAVQAEAAAPKAERKGLIELTDARHLQTHMKNPPILQGDWKAVGTKKCDHVQRGVIVLGAQQGRVLEVCLRESKCKTHWPPPPPMWNERDVEKSKSGKPSRAELAHQAEQRKIRRWGQVRKQALVVARAKAKGVNLAAALPVLAYGLKPWKTPEPTLEKLVLYVLNDKTTYADRAAFERYIAKPLGVNLRGIEVEAFPPKSAKKAKVRAARIEKRAAKRKLGLSKTAPKGEARPLGTKAKGGRRRKAGKKR